MAGIVWLEKQAMVTSDPVLQYLAEIGWEASWRQLEFLGESFLSMGKLAIPAAGIFTPRDQQ